MRLYIDSSQSMTTVNEKNLGVALTGMDVSDKLQTSILSYLERYAGEKIQLILNSSVLRIAVSGDYDSSPKVDGSYYVWIGRLKEHQTIFSEKKVADDYFSEIVYKATDFSSPLILFVGERRKKKGKWEHVYSHLFVVNPTLPRKDDESIFMLPLSWGDASPITDVINKMMASEII